MRMPVTMEEIILPRPAIGKRVSKLEFSTHYCVSKLNHCVVWIIAVKGRRVYKPVIHPHNESNSL